MSDLSDFDVMATAPGSGLTAHPDTIVAAETSAIALNTALDRFIKGCIPHLDPTQLRRLADNIPRSLLGIDAPSQAFDQNFSIADELTSQIQAVQALRQHVFPGGHFKIDGSVKEAKEVLTTCNQMTKTLIDAHERVMNMERFRAVEGATLDVLADMNDELKNTFLQRLALKLEDLDQ
jgi:hypothetical protein